MNIVRFNGGLGNQMFQYALYRKFQVKGVPVKADLSDFSSGGSSSDIEMELLLFPIKLDVCNRLQKKLKYNDITRSMEKRLGINALFYKEHECSRYDEEVFRRRFAFYDGYWQTEKYFEDIRETLIKDFTFPEDVTEQESILAEKIRKTNSVSVHIRRGDYLTKSEKYGNICTEEYYKKAIDYIKSKISEPVFFVFSNDMEWSKQFLGKDKNVYFVELGREIPAIHDMKLMSACKHNIIANSSFSWWASWLNQNPEKIVYAPERWLNTDECPDIRCKNWIIYRGDIK